MHCLAIYLMPLLLKDGERLDIRLVLRFPLIAHLSLHNTNPNNIHVYCNALFNKTRKNQPHSVTLTLLLPLTTLSRLSLLVSLDFPTPNLFPACWGDFQSDNRRRARNVNSRFQGMVWIMNSKTWYCLQLSNEKESWTLLRICRA